MEPNESLPPDTFFDFADEFIVLTILDDVNYDEWILETEFIQ